MSATTLKTIFIKGLLPLAVLFGAFSYMGYLAKTRPQAPQQKPPERVDLVEVVPARQVGEHVIVHAVGRAVAARETVLSPEVSGRVVEVNPKLVAGGVLSAGDVAFRLDAEDYELLVRQQAAQVTRARVDLQQEAGRRAVAEQEWELLAEEVKTTAEGKALALRRPQLELAKANLAAAQSALAQAKLRRDKTVITVPFNATVTRESVEEGLLAGPSAQLAALVGTDSFWIAAAVPIDKLSWIDIPGVGGFAGDYGSTVRVIQHLGDGQHVERTGRVLRLENTLDQLGVQAQVIVEVRDPLRLAPDAEPGMPLLLNAFVQLEIEGHPVEGAVQVPRVALRDGDRVWVMKDERLDVREVEIVWRDEESVLVKRGLTVGDPIITSKLSTPVPGMKIRVAAETPDAKAPGAPAGGAAPVAGGTEGH
ncbi:MAG: efflux RND transporter periplasmic adaptor subunit [Deltaproteobacteria bacterium]|nr:MAG: efflux RND transporter periplasmic adaptor subunit [Deltaproteobacteria bacterium]